LCKFNNYPSILLLATHYYVDVAKGEGVFNILNKDCATFKLLRFLILFFYVIIIFIIKINSLVLVYLINVK